MNSNVMSKSIYLAISLHNTQYPTTIEVLNTLLPVNCSQTWSVMNFLVSAYPGKQVERPSSGGVLTGHSITCSVSVNTNMTVSEQNL